MIEQKKMDAELLPCPHCNGGAEMRLYDGDYFVQCVECFASTAADYQTEQSAAEKWNRRSLPVGVPDGYALVPVEPTPQMLRAGVAQAVGAYPIYRAMLAAAPTVKAEQVQAMPQEWWQIIHDTLRDYRMSTLGDGEGGGYPLIDAMTADGQSVAGGIEECTYLADAIWNALPTQAPSLPAAGSDELPEPTYESIYRTALSAAEEVEVVAWRYRHSKQEKWQAGVERKSLWEAEPLMTVAQHNRIVAALSAQQSAPAYGSYTTRPAEAVAGIALRQLGDESRWVEIRDLNAHAFPGIGPHDYYPVGTVLRMPAEQQSAPERVSVPEGWRPVIAMVLQALDRDAAEGKAARGEMAAELRALLNGGGV